MLKDIVEVNIGSMTGTGRWIDPTLESYGTIAFDRRFMEQHIGLGRAVIDGGVFVGFDPARNPGMLNLSVWLAFVPVAYREDVEWAAMYPLWDRFMRTKVDRTLIPRYVDALRRWIGENIEPTDEPYPRRIRFANAWKEVGVRAAYDTGRITLADADAFMRDS